MNLGKKIVSVVAGVALVAGAGAIAAAPAQAKPKPKPKVTGTTIISFDKTLAPVVAGIVPVAPAKKTGTQLSFPVYKVVGLAVDHRGAFKIGTLEASNPVISYVDTANATAIVIVTVGGNPLPLFSIKNFKIRSETKTRVIWQGFLHLSDNQAIVDALNGAVGQAVFTPDMGLGQIRTTINR